MSQTNKPLSKTQIKFLRSKAHKLKPVVMIGDKGLTENVLEEINLALSHHELIKVRIRTEERDDKKAMISEICKQTKAQEVQVIGHVVALYRRSDDVKIVLPK
ncbi:ribosome assembly RNA-binding protein YhbY [Kangiella spongicola]|uniref:Ribosome assembly RNA-binding protein YhbY n=1 Tax=Kangiella spongicola TaxID=796379 RepID=A0A318DA05_9GAMM|nr:ribosome assembly RNA-binding protein YhbY [Kangiella spongicola]PXF64084.1 ribosome assembly RNA-binding protein YhbY [Kangiella spongicola]